MDDESPAAALVQTFQDADPEDGEIVVVEGPPGCAAGQIQGRREEQQDSYGWVREPGHGNVPEQWVLFLADGMGGHAGGATASRIVVETFGNAFLETRRAVSERLEESLERVNWEVGRAVRSNPALVGMGATLVAAHISNGQLVRWLSVGDSPMWRYADGRLDRLNRDHSMTPVLGQLVELGFLTEEEAAADDRHHQLRSVVMGDEIPLKDLQDDAIELTEGEVLIVASDGLETLSVEEIAGIIAGHLASAATMVRALLASVRKIERPRQDNATVIVYVPPTGDDEPITREIPNIER